ncbi:DUF3883 domain-containing protein [[Flexibacter] sp. ATCC 35208]|uniref:protein NO VEIN domain-containing protein n=1 Tax=[Flexibacter] sp. ATCC 35208 TaxID=1936242 RepID=UPI0009C53995|nr:DUF3883 domain-containing protein [[Flexibacter] sp. ATCC 35208]OMP77068.1 hypothetical protein BW716_21745 [[Flexibacter] sp. ATCC 35208]
MENITIETAEDYQKQSELNDMRQHANKIIQGIKKLNNKDANRAIWELFQNAVDLSSECIIEIKISEDTFEFSHNGEPFTPMTLDCLFKQVSSKTLEEKKEQYEENDPVGQYGTGFMTSHVFGKKLSIDGAIIKGSGYVALNNFVINRQTDNWLLLAGEIRDLKKEVVNLLNKEALIGQFPRTKFTYTFSNDYNRKCASNAVGSLGLILPYVMTLNPRLKSVKVTDSNGVETFYHREDIYKVGELQVRRIKINQDLKEVCFLESEDKKVTVILPINAQFEATDLPDALPRIFLYYPLVGSEHFGVNFLVHSRQFQPTEPRDGLHLKSENESNKKEEERNQWLIMHASEKIFDFIAAHTDKIKSPIKMASVNFIVNGEDELLNEYFKGLKAVWIDKFKELELVETGSKRISPSNTTFLHRELLEDISSFDAIYSLVSQFLTNIPKSEIIMEWAQKIREWDVQDIKEIKIKDLITELQKLGHLDGITNKEDLKTFYRYIINLEYAEVFNTCNLLPNIKGEFRCIIGDKGLNQSHNITPELIAIADVLVPEIPKRHVHPDFTFDITFPSYSRKNYVSEVNEHVLRVVAEKGSVKILPAPFFDKLLDYAKIVSYADASNVPTNMMKLMARYYGKSEEVIVIPTIADDEIDVRTVQKRLVSALLNDISASDSKWVADEVAYLQELFSVGAKYEAYEDYFKTSKVFPNQLNELAVQNTLRTDAGIPSEIKDMYGDVVSPNPSIRAELVHSDFKKYLTNPNPMEINEVTAKIETKFFITTSVKSISEHPYKKQILSIIEEFKRSDKYKEYFPLVYLKKSEILVTLADGEDTFKILTLNAAKIKKLAELGRDPNFEEIVKLGKEEFERKRQEQNNMLYKYTIGTHIESVLRNNLSKIIPDSIEADFKNVQDGQDIIVKVLGESLYHIEVKSRWATNSSVRMSKNQTLTAYKEKDRYALCTVDMTKYEGVDRETICDLDKIKHCIRFNKEIGYDVSHLVTILNQSEKMEEIHLDGDYRTLVPMRYIEDGWDLDRFIKYLIEVINKRIEDTNSQNEIAKP